MDGLCRTCDPVKNREKLVDVCTNYSCQYTFYRAAIWSHVGPLATKEKNRRRTVGK